jgi:hypothetical protein
MTGGNDDKLMTVTGSRQCASWDPNGLARCTAGVLRKL